MGTRHRQDRRRFLHALGRSGPRLKDFPMSHDAVTEELFFQRAGLDRDSTNALVADTLTGADDGELFLEYRQSESIALDDGKIKSANFDTSLGFRLRAVSGEATGGAHASEFSEGA